MRISFISSLTIALVLTGCGGHAGYPPSVPLPPELLQRELKDRAALTIDVRDVDGDPAHDAVVTLRLVLSGPDWPEVHLKRAGHFRYVDQLAGGTYRIDVALNGHRSEWRRVSATGAPHYELVWMLSPDMVGYYAGGRRYPVTQTRRSEIVVEHRGAIERVRGVARQLGFTVPTAQPPQLRENQLLLRAPRGADSVLCVLGHELERATGGTTYLVVEHGRRFVALSRSMTATFVRTPRLHGMAEHLSSLGFDTTRMHDLGTGLWRVHYAGGPCRSFLEAIDSLVRDGSVLSPFNELLQLEGDTDILLEE